MSFTYKRKSKGPRTDPSGTPWEHFSFLDIKSSIAVV